MPRYSWRLLSYLLEAQSSLKTDIIFEIEIKVSKSRKQNMVSSILPKTEWKEDAKYFASKIYWPLKVDYIGTIKVPIGM